jgi:vancomycin permeability regulator SanA
MLKIIKISWKLSIILAFLLLLPFIYMNWVVFSKSYDKNITAETAIVFGAAVTPEKEPSTILRLRLEKSRQLFLENKIKTIIVSGSKGDFKGRKWISHPRNLQTSSPKISSNQSYNHNPKFSPSKI